MRRRWLAIHVLGTAVLVLPVVQTHERQTLPRERQFTVTATACGFTPSRLEVNRNDVVRIDFIAEDRPYSFVIDEYRIAKRATPGHPARFEFGAVITGSFTFYSDLLAERCHNVRGTLVVSDAAESGDS